MILIKEDSFGTVLLEHNFSNVDNFDVHEDIVEMMQTYWCTLGVLTKKIKRQYYDKRCSSAC